MLWETCQAWDLTSKGLSSYMIWDLIFLTIRFYVHETETVLPNLWGSARGRDTNKYLLFFYSGISWKHLCTSTP